MPLPEYQSDRGSIAGAMETLIPFIGYHSSGKKVKEKMDITGTQRPGEDGRTRQEKEQDRQQLQLAIARIQDGKALRILRTLAGRMARRESV